MTGGTLGTDYTYSGPDPSEPGGAGVLTVKTSTELTISTNNATESPANGRIMIESNVTANITLAGLSIKPAENSTDDGYSGIVLGSGATLNITLQSGSSNVINGGKSSTAGTPAPGIHVPEGSTLTITGNGSLEVNGAYDDTNAPAVGIGGMGSSSDAGGACGNVLILGGTITVHGGTSSTRSSVDIGGGASDTGKGGDCNTVIILTSVNSGGGLTIGGGKGLSSNNGSDGAGIRPAEGGTYTVYGNLTLPCDITIPDGATVTIPDGTSLTVPENVTLTNNGTIQNNGGSFINDGTVTGDGQQPADSRYTINYEEETITIADGYEVYTAETDGDKIESNTSITEYIGQTLYLQQTASETTGRTAISILARPEAPETSSVSIDYAGEKLSFPSGVTPANLEYALSQSDPNWQDVPSGAALSEMGWDGNAEKTYYFRTGATDASFASSATTTPITAPARPAKPADPTTVEVTSNSITIQVVSGQEYRLGSSGDWETLTGTTGSDGQTVYTYDNLNSGTEYTIETRTPAETTTENKFASHPASVTVTTKTSAGAAPTVGAADVTDTTITLPYDAAWEYSTDQQSWSDTHEFTGLTAATQYTYYVRVAETETAEASEIATVTVYTAHATPTEGTGYTISYRDETATATTGYEILNGESWTTEAVKIIPSSSFQVRHVATEGGAPASEPLTVQIAERPTAPTGLSHTDETLAGMNDGTISGVTTAMEYKLSTASEWTPCAGTTITHLAPGTYQVRTAATDAAFAGEAASVTIEEVVEIQIDKSESSIELGSEGVVLTATITGIEDVNKAENWIWTSSNDKVAEVIRLTPEADALTTRSTYSPIESTARVTPVGEGTATITVTYTGTKYTATKTYDITVKAKEEEPAPDPKPDPTPLYYNIQFEDICEGVDASLSKSVVKAGSQVSVYVEVEEGYDAENLKVMFKRSLYGYWEEVEEGVQPGEYIIYNVYTDIYVKVEGVEKIEEEPTGMSDIESTKVYTQNGNLYVYTSQLKEVAIITMNGTVLRRERQEGLWSYSLPKGVYIICIGEERYKIAVR